MKLTNATPELLSRMKTGPLEGDLLPSFLGRKVVGKLKILADQGFHEYMDTIHTYMLYIYYHIYIHTQLKISGLLILNKTAYFSLDMLELLLDKFNFFKHENFNTI